MKPKIKVTGNVLRTSRVTYGHVSLSRPSGVENTPIPRRLGDGYGPVVINRCWNVFDGALNGWQIRFCGMKMAVDSAVKATKTATSSNYNSLYFCNAVVFLWRCCGLNTSDLHQFLQLYRYSEPHISRWYRAYYICEYATVCIKNVFLVCIFGHNSIIANVNCWVPPR